MAAKRIKSIVLVGHDNEGSAFLFERIVGSFPENDFLMVVCHGLYYKKSFLQSVLRILREASWLFVLFRFVELARFSLTGEGMSRKCRNRGIQVVHTHDVNSPETIGEIRAFRPDLLVSLYTMQIYKTPVLQIAKYGSISSHPSLLPKYRGLEVFFWVLANDEKETGASVFFIDERIDAGQVLRQQVIPITPEMTVASLYRRITEVAGDLLVKAIDDIDRGEVSVVRTEGAGAYYRMPDRAAYRRFRAAGRKFF